MLYAINVADMTKDPILSQVLIGPLVPNRIIVKAEPDRIDGGAVQLQCSEEQAENVLAVIRLKYKPHEFRVYRSKTGKRWVRAKEAHLAEKESADDNGRS